MIADAPPKRKWGAKRLALAGLLAAAACLAASCGGGGAESSPPLPDVPTTPLAWEQGSWDQVRWQ